MKKITRKSSLTAYSSDASLYAIQPQEVRQVYSDTDAVEAVRSARKRRIPIIPRGAGTGVTGGAVGAGIVLDFGQYRNIVEINPESKYVITQVGIIYDELNTALKKHNLFFPPDPSSGDSCQIGGILANNASGPRSVKYGLTSDFIEEFGIVDSSGSPVKLKKYKLDSAEIEDFFKVHPEYQKILNLLRDNAALIDKRWPRLKKNSSGYNLKQVVDDLGRGIFNLPALMVGSEGTLAVFLSARLSLLPLPREKLTIRVYFKSLVSAGRVVTDILELGPSGLEIVDGATLDLIGKEKYGIPPDVAAMLLVEFDDEISRKKESFRRLADSFDLAAPPDYAHNSDDAAALWQARKAIVPTLYRHHPTKRPISLIEDVSIPPETIPSFIEYMEGLFKRHNLTYGIFGHIGDGNLHIRPLFDLNNTDDFRLALEIYDTVYGKVISLGGSTTAEHADGRLRAPLLRKLYGDEIYQIFKRIKELLDPENIFSPGSILSEDSFIKNIDYEKIKSFCAACGKCNGYCPAYDLFRREDFSPRGWLRMINQSDASERELSEYLKFCLNCKNCTDVCPAGVDIASEIIEFKSRRPSATARMISTLADNEVFLSLSLKMGKIAEPLIHNSLGRNLTALAGRIAFGFDKTTAFPKIARRNLRQRFTDRIGNSGEVAFFHGCADNLLESSVGEAVFKVFDRLHIDIKMPEQKCCGLPYEVYGLKDNLIEKAKYNIDRLMDFDAVITGCASCLLRLKEYEKLLESNPEYASKASQLARKCYDISQYLNQREIDYSVFNSDGKITVTYHNPCHLRAAGLHREPEKLLSRFNNTEIIHADYADRCCAQAGSYGYLHYREAREMFAKKKEAYNAIEADYIMSSCPACQMKIRAEMKDKFKVVHPIEILAARLS